MSATIRHHAEPPDGWVALARASGSFYHEPAWILGLRDTFRFPVDFLSAEESDTLVGILPLAEVPALLGPRRLVSLPFSYAAGAVASSTAIVQALASGARDLARSRGIRRVEIKQLRPSGDPTPGFVRSAHYLTYRIATEQGEEAVWRGLHQGSTQRSIRKGIKAGVTAALGESAGDWLAMAELQEATSHRLGLPAPPRRFFTEMCRRLGDQELTRLYLAHTPDGGLAAGIVLWTGARDWIYAFGASRPESLEFRPNHVLLWEAIRDALRAGRGFDLGRAAPEQEGLSEFKRRWGGEEIPLAYDYWPAAAGLNVARRDAGPLAIASRLWRLLPAPAARAGSVLYRYLG